MHVFKKHMHDLIQLNDRTFQAKIHLVLLANIGKLLQFSKNDGLTLASKHQILVSYLKEVL